MVHCGSLIITALLQVQKKLQTEIYKDVHSYACDVRLIFDNAEEYNGSKSVVFRDSKVCLCYCSSLTLILSLLDQFMRKLFESKFYTVCGGEDPTKQKKKRKATAQLSENSTSSVVVNLPTDCGMCSKKVAEQVGN